jgi:hypothetical protein
MLSLTLFARSQQRVCLRCGNVRLLRDDQRYGLGNHHGVQAALLCQVSCNKRLAQL